jgi:DNA-cytosine methyltransferase
MHPLTLGTLASGGLDGIADAAQKVNIEVKFHCEIDPRRREMLRQLYGKDAVIYHDVRTMGEQQPPKVDIIGITAPCTSFSIAGKRKGFDDPNGQLLFTTLDRINELRPKYFILENSPQLLNAQGAEQVFNRIAEIGYNAEWTCLPLTTFGLPTQRERLYLVAWLPDITSNMQSGRHILLQEPRKMQNLPAGWWSGTPDLLAVLGRVRQARATLYSPTTNVGLFAEVHFNENTQHQEVPQNDYFAHLHNNELNRLIAAAGDSISPRAARWLLQCLLGFHKKHREKTKPNHHEPSII